jgi:hypothetical protein
MDSNVLNRLHCFPELRTRVNTIIPQLLQSLFCGSREGTLVGFVQRGVDETHHAAGTLTFILAEVGDLGHVST